MALQQVHPGKAYPLGATYDGFGTNFSIFSSVAQRVELCLFNEAGKEFRIDLPEVTAYCWHGYLPHVQPGQRYGFRIHGPWAPEKGHRCNPSKLLIDPYAKAIEGTVKWDESVYSHYCNDPERLLNEEDSAPFVPRAVVTNPYFNWDNDRPPGVPLHETIIYEMHIKGFTCRHPGIPPHIRGTYAGISHSAAIEYLNRLGVNAVELMPVHQFIHDYRLVRQGLRNYWGYNSIGYLAPHNEYSSRGQAGQQVQEFKQMVKNLHSAGVEVILDVVYNHTAEGDHSGPTLSFRGIDNAAYYRLDENNPGLYKDYTGTGNSMNMRHPHVLQLIMDSLRYWVLEMHVDGFRFDLASALARELHDVDRLSAFFDIIQQDPIISQVKLIAEPWDIGEGGYQVGNFPPLWSEWNGKYRDCIRDFWRGRDQILTEFARRFSGSSDLYETTGRRPYASVNFITAHDGFTLADLVSYNRKHNEDNCENCLDGTDDNRSWNCGAEGPTDIHAIISLRQRQKKNFLSTLFLSQGIPMLLFGDEAGRSQGGNNNPYCQDNEISWLDWSHLDVELLDFTRELISFRKDHPVFRKRGWFLGRPVHGSKVNDIAWFEPRGIQMHADSWANGLLQSIGVFLNGEAFRYPDLNGSPVVDDSFLILFNKSHENVRFVLPSEEWGSKWKKILDTGAGGFIGDSKVLRPGDEIPLKDHSMLLFRRLYEEE
ncbi:MAG: glycogen debranching protein GlgX [Syntrophales bacterium]|nr:glycogen debranching protein GlgX [Syntrophales bacterium]MDY0044058.1 glycogen debranching protein GlgX [Syntrophales bacterium]